MISLPQLRGKLRLGIWSLLCILTLLIFLYPAQLHYENIAIQSTKVFSHLPLFGILYYAWFLLILVLLFFPGGNGRRRDWENVALLSIFTLVFSGIWIILSHGYFGVDSFVPAGGTKYSLAEGHLYYPMSRGVIEFPTLTLLTSHISQVTGMEIFDVITLFLLFEALLFSTLLYLLFQNLIKDGRLASIGTMMVIGGSMTIADFLPQFHSRITGLLFLVVCLVLLTKDKPTISRSGPLTLLFVVLLAAITITHSVTGFVLCCILIGIYLVQKLSKSNLVNLSLVALVIAAYLAYEIYIALGASNYMFTFIPTLISNLFHGELFSFLSSRVISANVGGEVPPWANIAIFFWLLLILFGGLLGLRNLLRVRRIRDMERKVVGGLIGTALFLAISGVATQMTEAINRGLFYLPLFTTAFTLGFIDNLKAHAKKLTLVGLTLLLLLLSFPTFLAHNDAVSTGTIHSSEIAYAKFLGSKYSEPERLVIFVSAEFPLFINYEDTRIQKFIWFPYEPVTANQSSTWVEMVNFTSSFGNPNNNQTNILAFTPRLYDSLKGRLGTDPSVDPRWNGFIDKLAQENLIYSNGLTQLYQTGNR